MGQLGQGCSWFGLPHEQREKKPLLLDENMGLHHPISWGLSVSIIRICKVLNIAHFLVLSFFVSHLAVLW